MVQTIIKWSINGIFKADANKCYEEIQQIGDEVRPEQVLEKAKNKKSELHKCFDWNDSSAAVWEVGNQGYVSSNYILYTRDIRPVIVLSKAVLN